ncbi:methyltransferase type 12 [Elysia marginata]|uniref:Methyltransferase type 12 n=1 Tax=Elysia marginata TaxID=1093978 RepID=A0AAV4J125_9GAST|nr:methyltransferase type 12 [Elysia marginata]
MMHATKQEIEAGQAVYTRRMLLIYDIRVLMLSNRFIWKCPSSRLLAHYNMHVSANHLDVGVGSGYFLDRCRFPAVSPRLALMDMNPNSLAFTAKRIGRYSPEVYQQNILERISCDIVPFDSIALNYLLHCLPGTLAEKGVVFDYLQPVMKPGATVFGSTILNDKGVPGWSAAKLMGHYNRHGIFSNLADTLDGLQRALESRFQCVDIKTQGCVALFSATL